MSLRRRGKSRRKTAERIVTKTVFNRTTIPAAVLLALCIGCGGSWQSIPPGQDGPAGRESVLADAYLFDCKVYRRGKPTTVRLEVFSTDSITALGGRAYLGKGALKGILTPNRLTLYFPTRNEYVDQPVEEAVTSSDCPIRPGDFGLSDLLSRRPDSLGFGAGIQVVRRNPTETSRPEFAVFDEACSWRLELTYDRQGAGWRLARLEFSDGADLRVLAKRRRFKARANVQAGKFQVEIPAGAVRVSP